MWTSSSTATAAKPRWPPWPSSPATATAHRTSTGKSAWPTAGRRPGASWPWPWAAWCWPSPRPIFNSSARKTSWADPTPWERWMLALTLPALRPLSRPEPFTPEALDAACCAALKREADAWPKPGLVTPVDSGSHRDMNYASFVDSIGALAGYFAEVSTAGARGARYAALQPIAIAAEARMLAATRGANTHRGAIFNLGLLAAAAALRAARPGWAGWSCGAIVARVWGKDILASRITAPASHGEAVWRRYAAGGAREEAAGGFSAVYGLGLPALRRLLAAGVDEEVALVGTLMALMAELPDTNLLWRGGEAGLRDVQAAATAFNRSGGVRRPGWRDHLLDIHAWMVSRNLSPGGSADQVAATWLVHELEGA